jgi:hypothetical protein
VLKFASVAVIEVISNAVPAVCGVTVPELPDPEVNVSPGSVITSLETAPAFTVMEALAAEVVRGSPDVRAAVRVMLCAFVYWTDGSVTELVPAVIVAVLPDSVPAEPEPEWVLMANEMPVPATTLVALPVAS